MVGQQAAAREPLGAWAPGPVAAPVRAIPEPSAALVFALGGLVVAGAVRSRHRA